MVFSTNRAKRPDADFKERFAAVIVVKPRSQESNKVIDCMAHFVTDGLSPFLSVNPTNRVMMEDGCLGHL